MDELDILRDFRADQAELDPETSARIRAHILEAINAEPEAVNVTPLDRLANLGRRVVDIAWVVAEKVCR